MQRNISWASSRQRFTVAPFLCLLTATSGEILQTFQPPTEIKASFWFQPQAEPQCKMQLEGQWWQACGTEVSLSLHLMSSHFWLSIPNWCHHSQSAGWAGCCIFTVLVTLYLPGWRELNCRLMGRITGRLVSETRARLCSNVNIWSRNSHQALILKTRLSKCS